MYKYLNKEIRITDKDWDERNLVLKTLCYLEGKSPEAVLYLYQAMQLGIITDRQKNRRA